MAEPVQNNIHFDHVEDPFLEAALDHDISVHGMGQFETCSADQIFCLLRGKLQYQGNGDRRVPARLIIRI